jgi:hypothetical protein
LIYEGRLEKDKVFAENNQLFYVLLCHSVDSMICHNTFEIRVAFLSTLRQIIVAPFDSVYEAAKMSKVTKLNSAYGHSDTNPVYGTGYRLPIKRLLTFPHLKLAVQNSEELF